MDWSGFTNHGSTDVTIHDGKCWWGWGNVAPLHAIFERLHEAHDARFTQILQPMTVQQAAGHLPKPKIDKSMFSASVAHILSSDPFQRLLHSRGRDFIDIIKNARNDFRNAIDLVAFPETEEHIVTLLRDCSKHNIAVMPFGGGSSVVFAVEAPELKKYLGTLSLDMGLLKSIVNIDKASSIAQVQGGIYGPELEAKLKNHGVTLRHFPQSFEFSTLGGWLATRGGGHYATGATHVDEMCQAMRVVSPAGTTQTRTVPASGAGPAEHRVYLGSEGILGIIVEAWVRVRPRPSARAAATIIFPGKDADSGFVAGARAVQSLSQSGLQPANCRLVAGPEVARTMLMAGSKDTMTMESLQTASVLLIGIERADATQAALVNEELEILVNIATNEENKGVMRSYNKAKRNTSEKSAAGQREGIAGKWGAGFMAGGYMFSAAALFVDTIINTFETACTWSAFPAMHEHIMSAVKKTIRDVCKKDGEVTCRFTHIYPDGPAPYYTILIRGIEDTRDINGEDHRISKWNTIKKAAMDVIIQYGGTSTHHHAVGRLHVPHYEKEQGNLFSSSLVALKRVHDPKGILAPGVLIPERDEQSKL
eukprot:m.40606 g.40606  ORF g.40606 m.40606 type:complete len:593 (-) comp9685_c0_seq1:110-1888(-)